MNDQIDERLNPVLSAIADYSAKHRGSESSPLEISALYDLSPGQPHSCTITPPHSWPMPYPFSERAGVYFIFSESLQLLYVGKASTGASCIGKRLWTYFHHVDGEPMTLKHGTWTQQPRFLLTIAVPEGTPFEATALEEFLIRRLRPSDNSTGNSI